MAQMKDKYATIRSLAHLGIYLPLHHTITLGREYPIFCQELDWPGTRKCHCPRLVNHILSPQENLTSSPFPLLNFQKQYLHRKSPLIPKVIPHHIFSQSPNMARKLQGVVYQTMSDGNMGVHIYTGVEKIKAKGSPMTTPSMLFLAVKCEYDMLPHMVKS